MSSRRLSKVNEAIRETVASEILLRVRDPRVKNVTVLRAEASADLRTAKVYVTVLGDDKVQSLTMHGLRSACGYLQSRLADRLQTRFTPVLDFVLDPSVKVSIATSSVIRSALADGMATGGTAVGEAERDETDADDEALSDDLLSDDGMDDESDGAPDDSAGDESGSEGTDSAKSTAEGGGSPSG